MHKLLFVFAATLAAFLIALAARTAVASDASVPTPDFSFGVVPQQRLGVEDTTLMQSGGIDSVRLFLSWASVEGEQGGFEWSAVDATVAAAGAAGVVALPFLYGTPEWAARLDGQACSGGECAAFAPRSAATRDAFAAFAAAAVGRYGPDGEFWAAHPELTPSPIRSWQIWNEQNSPTFFAPAPSVGAYAALLRTTATAIRSVDPYAEVVLGGMWGTPAMREHVVPTTAYLRQLYRIPEIELSFDAIAAHPYAPRLAGVFAQIKAARRIATSAGDGAVPLWVTELGWASGGPRDQPLVSNPRRQARLLRGAFSTLFRKRLAWHVRGAFWYAWRDTASVEEAVCAWCPRAGLHSVDGQAKPAWTQLAALARR